MTNISAFCFKFYMFEMHSFMGMHAHKTVHLVVQVWRDL
jgi:hypothetical protein